MARQLRIGRAPDCDIVIDDRRVSRYHAVLTTDTSGAYIEHVGGQTGTTVNGVPVRGRMLLQRGDALGFGSITLDTELL